MRSEAARSGSDAAPHNCARARFGRTRRPLSAPDALESRLDPRPNRSWIEPVRIRRTGHRAPRTVAIIDSDDDRTPYLMLACRIVATEQPLRYVHIPATSLLQLQLVSGIKKTTH